MLTLKNIKERKEFIQKMIDFYQEELTILTSLHGLYSKPEYSDIKDLEEELTPLKPPEQNGTHQATMSLRAMTQCLTGAEPTKPKLNIPMTETERLASTLTKDHKSQTILRYMLNHQNKNKHTHLPKVPETAAVVDMAIGTLSKRLDRLIRLGLIEKVPNKSALYYLTKEGYSVLEKLSVHQSGKTGQNKRGSQERT